MGINHLLQQRARIDVGEHGYLHEVLVIDAISKPALHMFFQGNDPVLVGQQEDRLLHTLLTV